MNYHYKNNPDIIYCPSPNHNYNSFIMLYDYMSIAYSAFTLTNTIQTWTKMTQSKWHEMLSLTTISIALMGLLVSPLIMNLSS